MQTLKLSYVESLENKIEILQRVVGRLAKERTEAEALVKEKDEQIELAWDAEGRARSDYDAPDARLRSLEKKHWDLQDAHEETHKELVSLRRKVERW